MDRLINPPIHLYYNFETGEVWGDNQLEFEQKTEFYYRLRTLTNLFHITPSLFNDKAEVSLIKESFTRHENYTAPFTLTLSNDVRDTLSFEVQVTVTNELRPEGNDGNPLPEPPKPTEEDKYGLKYQIEWHGNDLDHDAYRLEFLYKDYEGSSSYLSGFADLEKPKVDNVLDCIRGTSATITIHANNKLDIKELYFEDEKTVQVLFYRNDELLFKGYVKPDGVGQSFVNQYYDLELDAIDNLGTLKNLAFLNKNKSNFNGKITQIQAIEAALNRTGLNLPINVRIDKKNNVTPEDGCALEYTKVNTEQYYKEDGTTEMDCEAVLKSILEPYGAIITQYKAEWYILSPLGIDSHNTTFHRYVDGRFDETIDLNLNENISSHVNDASGFYHINKNQWISMDGSLGALRIEYDYGSVENLFKNPNFKSDDDSISGWNLYSGEIMSDGIRTTDMDSLFFAINQDIVLNAGDALNIDLDFENRWGSHEFELMVNVGDYYLKGIDWVTDPNARTKIQNYSQDVDGKKLGKGRTTITVNALPLPTGGNLELSIKPINSGSINALLTFYSIKGYLGDKSILKGETHTIKKVGYASIVKDNIKVYNGDNRSDLYLGTLYDLEEKPIQFWRRDNFSFNTDLLRLMAEDHAILNAKPAQIFSGDVKGFFPYLCAYTIDSVEGQFIPTSYLFKTKENITELEGRQFYDNINNVGLAYEYEKEFDLKENVKPTI